MAESYIPLILQAPESASFPLGRSQAQEAEESLSFPAQAI